MYSRVPLCITGTTRTVLTTDLLFQGNHKCVKLLITKGANWKSKDNDGRWERILHSLPVILSFSPNMTVIHVYNNYVVFMIT